MEKRKVERRTLDINRRLSMPTAYCFDDFGSKELDDDRQRNTDFDLPDQRDAGTDDVIESRGTTPR